MQCTSRFTTKNFNELRQFIKFVKRYITKSVTSILFVGCFPYNHHLFLNVCTLAMPWLCWYDVWFGNIKLMFDGPRVSILELCLHNLYGTSKHQGKWNATWSGDFKIFVKNFQNCASWLFTCRLCAMKVLHYWQFLLGLSALTVTGSPSTTISSAF